jgi:predicted AAA+ superfamily ATPase
VSGLEIDLIIDKGNFLEAYEIKFSSSPKKNMISSLEKFLKEHINSRGALLTLRKEDLPLSENIKSKHFSYIIYND